MLHGTNCSGPEKYSIVLHIFSSRLSTGGLQRQVVLPEMGAMTVGRSTSTWPLHKVRAKWKAVGDILEEINNGKKKKKKSQLSDISQMLIGRRSSGVYSMADVGEMPWSKCPSIPFSRRRGGVFLWSESARRPHQGMAEGQETLNH
jgi:hypothetical protein